MKSERSEQVLMRAQAYLDVRKSQNIVQVNANGHPVPASTLGIEEAASLLQIASGRSFIPNRKA